MSKMKESQIIKDYAKQLFSMANKMRLHGKEFSNERIIQKILVTLPEKYEATISSLENSKDMSSISLVELVNALQALEQRRIMRQEGSIEGAFQAKSPNNGKDRKKKKKNNKSSNKKKNQKRANPPYPHYKKTNYPPQRCWWRPYVKCHNCGQLGYIERVCKTQQEGEIKVAAVDQYHEEQLFVTTYFASKNTSKSWLIDSGCTNHITYDQELFRELDKNTISKVRIVNGEYISVKGKWIVVIESLSNLKLIPNVLFVPDIDQNLLSVGQLLEKGFKVLFEDKFYMIKDANGKDVFKIKMRGKRYVLNLLEEQQVDVSQENNVTTLWHKRLGHFHHNGVLYMKKNQLAVGLPDLEQNLPTCIAYQYGKQSRLPFPHKFTWKASHKL